MAEECFSSSGTVPEVLPGVEGRLRWVGVQEEAGDHLEEGVGEVEGASYRQEVAGEAGRYQRKLAQVEEAEGHRGDRVGGEGLLEQQLPVSEERVLNVSKTVITSSTLDRSHFIGFVDQTKMKNSIFHVPVQIP